MEEQQPRPDPEPQAEAKKDAQSQTGGAARGEPPRRSGGEAYTDRPEFHVQKRAWWPIALALAVALSGIGVAHRQTAPVAPPVAGRIGTMIAAPIGTQTLLYSAKDYDAATTQAARAALARAKASGQALPVPAERPGQPFAAPAAPASPGAQAAPVAPAASPELQAERELAVAPQALRDQISSGRAGFYTFHVAELVDEGGDVYDISVDGAPLLRITTSRELSAITIPMDVSRPHTVTQTLVFARPRGVYVLGPGNSTPAPTPNQASFSVRTSVGQAQSHLSSAGDSSSWSAQFSGAPPAP